MNDTVTTRRVFLGSLPGLPAAAMLAEQEPPSRSAQQSTVCDVLAFGAAGDGVADDTRAILAALQACPPGGKLVFPPGRRYRTGQVIVTKDLLIEADGATVVLAGKDAGFWVQGTVNLFRVRGGTYLGSGDPDEYQITWRFGDVSDARITNVLIDGVTISRCAVGVKVAGTRDQPITEVTLRNCRIVEAVGTVPGRGSGVAFTHGNYGKVIGCHFENCQRHELYFAEGGQYTAVGNSFKAHRAGVAEGAPFVALAVARSDNVSVAGNIFDGCLDGALGIETDPAGTKCRNVTVTGNSFLNSEAFDVLIGNDDPRTHGLPQNVAIVGNAFFRDHAIPAGTAIDVRCGAYLTIANNTFFHEATTGQGAPTAIYLRGTGGDQYTQYVAIHGNTFRGDAPRGLATAVEIAGTIARGHSTVYLSANLDHTPGGVRTDGRPTNRNLRIG